jgi:hypothetical protein
MYYLFEQESIILSKRRMFSYSRSFGEDIIQAAEASVMARGGVLFNEWLRVAFGISGRL